MGKKRKKLVANFSAKRSSLEDMNEEEIFQGPYLPKEEDVEDEEDVEEIVNTIDDDDDDYFPDEEDEEETTVTVTLEEEKVESSPKENGKETNIALEIMGKLDSMRVENQKRLEEAQRKYKQVASMENLFKRFMEIFRQNGIEIPEKLYYGLLFVAVEEVQFRNRLIQKKEANKLLDSKTFAAAKAMVKEIMESDFS